MLDLFAKHQKSSLVSVQQSPRPCQPPSERRIAPRYRDGQRAFLFSSKDPSAAVEIIESNGSGFRLSYSEALKSGTQHWLLVSFRGISVRFLLRVVWSRKCINGSWNIGARLLLQNEADRQHMVSYRHYIHRNPRAA